MPTSQEKPPRVSVLMAVCNGADWLEESIDSILSQTAAGWELVVVDDASTDETPRVLAAVQDPRVRVLANPENRGLPASLNRALGEARGEYVARQDADDVSRSDRLARQVSFLDSHPAVGVVGSQTEIFDERGQPAGVFRAPVGHGEIVWETFFGQPFAHPTVMMRRELLQKAGGYDEGFLVAQDIELWSRLYTRTTFANIPEPLVRYRTHPAAASRARQPEQIENLARARTQAIEQLSGVRDIESMARLFLRASVRSQDAPLTDVEAKRVIAFLQDVHCAARREGHIPEADEDAVRRRMLDRLLSVSRSTAIHVGSVPRNELALHYWRSVLPRPLWVAALALMKPRRALEIWGERREALGASSTRPLAELTVDTSQAGADAEPSLPNAHGEGLSVVILSYRRPAALSRLVEGLLGQRLEGLDLEVIVCNNAPDIRIEASRRTRLGRQLRRLPDLKVFNSSHNWKCQVRYPIATLARHETILFIDDDITLLCDDFLQRMLRVFRTLGANDILSCWNMLWAHWTPEHLDEVPVTFEQPEIAQVVECDTCGAGISMFSRKILMNPDVLNLSQGYPRADDMAFGPIAHLVCGSRVFYMPCHGLLQMHREHRRGALHKDPQHFVDLYALYRSLVYDRGYRPVLERNPADDTVERHLARELPQRRSPWRARGESREAQTK